MSLFVCRVNRPCINGRRRSHKTVKSPHVLLQAFSRSSSGACHFDKDLSSPITQTPRSRERKSFAKIGQITVICMDNRLFWNPPTHTLFSFYSINNQVACVARQPWHKYTLRCFNTMSMPGTGPTLSCGYWRLAKEFACSTSHLVYLSVKFEILKMSVTFII